MATSRRLPSSYNTSTYGDGTRDYSSLSAWESDTDIDLVSAAAGEVLLVYDDNSPYTDPVSIAGATTNSDYFRVIAPVSGSENKGWECRGITFQSSTADYVFDIDEQYSGIYDFKIILLANGKYGIRIYLGDCGYNPLVGLFIMQDGEYGQNRGIYLRPWYSTGHTYIVNCIVTGIRGSYSNLSYGLFYDGGAGDNHSVFVYNSSFVFCDYNLHSEDAVAGRCIAKNVISEYGDSAEWDGNWTRTTCTNDNGGVLFELITDVRNTFADLSYLVVNHEDTVANEQGTDLSADSDFDFDDDIGLNTISTWSIGVGVAAVPTTTDGSSRRMPVSYSTSTYGDGTRDYTSLSAWESDTDIDVAAAENGEVLELYDDGTPYSDYISMYGALCTSDYFRVVKAATVDIHEGYTDAGVCLERILTSSNAHIISIGESYSCAYDLKCNIDYDSGTSSTEVSAVYARGGRCVFSGIIATYDTGTYREDTRGFEHDVSATAASNFFINCLAYRFNDTDSSGFYVPGSGLDIVFRNILKGYFYNCTSVDNYFCFSKADNVSHVIKNCIAENATSETYQDDFPSGEVWSLTTCTDESGVSFVDAVNRDYHLASGDTAAIDQGTNLESDSVFAFNDDVATGLRTSGDWSIGFHEPDPPLTNTFSVTPNVSAEFESFGSSSISETASVSASFSSEGASSFSEMINVGATFSAISPVFSYFLGKNNLGISRFSHFDAGLGYQILQSLLSQLGESSKIYQAIRATLARGDVIQNNQSIMNALFQELEVRQAVVYENSVEFRVMQKLVSILSSASVAVRQQLLYSLLLNNDVRAYQHNSQSLSDLRSQFYATSSQVYLDGQPIANSGRVYDIRILYDENSVHNEITMSSSDHDLFWIADPEYLYGEVRIEIQIGTRVIQFLLDSREGDMTNFTLTGLSVSAKEDSPYAIDIDYSLTEPRLASEIAADLTTYCVVDWQVTDWVVPTDFSFSGPPLDGLQALASEIGAVVRCQDDGSLLIRKRRPIRPINMDGTGADVNYDRANLIALSHNSEQESGYNAVEVIGKTAEAFLPQLQIEDIVEEDGSTRGPRQGEECFVRVYWAGHGRTSSVLSTYVTDGRMSIVGGGAFYRDTKEEVLDFKDGVASVSLPIYRLISYEWIGDSGGSISYERHGTDFSISDNRFRIARVQYENQYQRYRLTDHDVERLIAVLVLAINPNVDVSVRTAAAPVYGNPINASLLTTEDAARERAIAWIDQQYRKSLCSISAPYDDDAIDGNLAFINDSHIGSSGNYHIVSSSIIINGPQITNQLKVEKCLTFFNS